MAAAPPLDGVGRLLIVKTSSIGDVIHALPAVSAIKAARPDLHLGWVVRARSADALKGCPWIDSLYALPDRPSLRDLLALRSQLHAAPYDCVLDMQGLALSGLITWLSGAPIRVGWDRNREGNALWMTHAIIPGRASDQRGDRHEVDALYGFAQPFGVPGPLQDFPPQTYLGADSAGEAGAWLENLPRPVVALNTGAARAYKRWPQANWAELADLVAGLGWGVVFVGDSHDHIAIGEIQSMRRQRANTIDLSGKTDLRQLAAVFAACDLVVSGDTGPMHLSVAVGTPVVALFGATNPARHGPFGSRNTILRGTDGPALARRPTDAEGAAAMCAISPANVLAAIKKELNSWHPAGSRGPQI